MNNKTVCILLIDGFEDVEALMPADIFKRLGLGVILAGVESTKIRSAHDFYIATDTLLRDVSVADFDALMLPGGLPGAVNLRDSSAVTQIINQTYANKKVCAAICAAPIVLRDAGIAKDNGLIITAKGMGKAAPFAFEIARALGVAEEKIRDVAENSFINI